MVNITANTIYIKKYTFNIELPDLALMKRHMNLLWSLDTQCCHQCAGIGSPDVRRSPSLKSVDIIWIQKIVRKIGIQSLHLMPVLRFFSVSSCDIGQKSLPVGNLHWILYATESHAE